MKIADSIANEFNEFSSNYTNDMIGCVPHYIKLMSCFTEDLPDNFTAETILDLGCGNGNVTSELVQLFPKAHYVLLDASHEMIELCKNRFEGFNVEYITSYFKDYLFKDNSFDMVTAGFSLHHCEAEEKKQHFHNIHGSLKKGGVFGYSDLMINKNTPEHVKLLKEWKSFVLKSFPDGEKWEWLMEHYDEFDRPNDLDDQTDWLKQAGFTTIQITAQDRYWVHIRAIRD